MELILSEVEISKTGEMISLSHLNGFLNMQNLVEHTENPTARKWALTCYILY